MTYEQTLEYLYSKLPMFSRIGAAAYKNNLDNTISLCDYLNSPQHEFRSVHIAGTNGKGSTSHMLAAILQQQGYKTGLYTSPHINDFRERIRINGEMISKAFVMEFAEHTRNITQQIQPSFFELTVAMAFSYFAKNKVDIAIIETGMGGRLDSTNIITPILSIITNISLDHTQFLGTTMEAIAAEKAGIIKHQIPIIIGESQLATKPVFIDKANEMNAPIHFADEMYAVVSTQKETHFQNCDITDLSNGHTESFTLDLIGNYQLNNIKSVLAAEKILMSMGFNIDHQNEKSALQQVKKTTGLRGRWDILSEQPLVIADVAHNKAGIQQILDQLAKDFESSKVHFILGFVKDKDVQSVLQLFPIDAHFYFTNAHIERAIPYKELKSQAESIGMMGKGFDNVNEAIADAKHNMQKDDIILICGSFFITAEIDDF